MKQYEEPKLTVLELWNKDIVTGSPQDYVDENFWEGFVRG